MLFQVGGQGTRPTFFEMAAAQQTSIRAALTYSVGVLALRRPFLHRVLDYEVSGFVFCYACIFKYVSQYKRCPITLIRTTVDQIRRLFHDV